MLFSHCLLHYFNNVNMVTKLKYKVSLSLYFRRKLQYDSKYPMNFNVSIYHCWSFPQNYPKLTNKLKEQNPACYYSGSIPQRKI